MTRYPFVALLSHSGSYGKVLVSAAGATAPQQLLPALQAAYEAEQAERAVDQAQAQEQVRPELLLSLCTVP